MIGNLDPMDDPGVNVWRIRIKHFGLHLLVVAGRELGHWVGVENGVVERSQMLAFSPVVGGI